MKLKRTYYLLVAIVLGLGLESRSQGIGAEQISQYTHEIYDSLVNIRRSIHQHPEIAGEEEKTAEMVANYLRRLGLVVKTGIAGHGVVGILKGGLPGKNIAWRADLDALVNDDDDPVSFRSVRKGKRHICGHDVHTTIALGIANVLAKHQSTLRGTAYFVFQPSEENFKGAKRMVDEGLFDWLDADEIFAAHIVPMPVGQIATKANELYSYTRTVRIRFHVKAPVDSLKKVATAAYESLHRNQPKTAPWVLDHIFAPTIGINHPSTIYTDYFIPQGKLRVIKTAAYIDFYGTFNETSQQRLGDIIRTLETKISASKYGKALASVAYLQEMPTVVNHPSLTKQAITTLQGVYGNTNIQQLYGQIPFFNDDFAYFQQKVPGVYFFVGGSNPEKGIVAMPHTPAFQVDESSILYAVQYFANLMMARNNI